MGTPLRVVAGSESYALAATFYSDDHPSHFIDFSTRDAPWIDEMRLSRDGLAIICAFNDDACFDQTRRFQSLDSVRVTLNSLSKTFLWHEGRSFSFSLLFVRPGQPIRLAGCADCVNHSQTGDHASDDR